MFSQRRNEIAPNVGSEVQEKGCNAGLFSTPIHVTEDSQSLVLEFDLTGKFERKEVYRKKERSVFMHMNWVGMKT